MHGSLIYLAQFYDPSLKCFTFQDFQLAPTIEEFERILGRYLKYFCPFTGLGETPSLDMIAATLSVLVRDVVACLEVKGATHGFSKKSLEAKSQAIKEANNGKVFNVVLALLIYIVFLFPDMDDFIGPIIINIFLSKNPVPALLADVYYYHHARHENRKGMVMCCSPRIYTWLMSNMPKDGPFIAKDLRWP